MRKSWHQQPAKILGIKMEEKSQAGPAIVATSSGNANKPPGFKPKAPSKFAGETRTHFGGCRKPLMPPNPGNPLGNVIAPTMLKLHEKGLLPSARIIIIIITIIKTRFNINENRSWKRFAQAATETEANKIRPKLDLSIWKHCEHHQMSFKKDQKKIWETPSFSTHPFWIYHLKQKQDFICIYFRIYFRPSCESNPI